MRLIEILFLSPFESTMLSFSGDFFLRSSCIICLQTVLNLQVPVEHSKEVSDCKNLIKTLVMGNMLS